MQSAHKILLIYPAGMILAQRLWTFNKVVMNAKLGEEPAGGEIMILYQRTIILFEGGDEAEVLSIVEEGIVSEITN